MTRISRRTLLAGLALLPGGPVAAQPETVRDGGGRLVPVPARIARVFPAGPPAAIVL